MVVALEKQPLRKVSRQKRSSGRLWVDSSSLRMGVDRYNVRTKLSSAIRSFGQRRHQYGAAGGLLDKPHIGSAEIRCLQTVDGAYHDPGERCSFRNRSN